MDKVTVALGSFIVGACSAFIMLSGSHISTIVQSSSVSAEETTKAPGVAFIGSKALIPKVPGLGLTLGKVSFAGGKQQLDGLKCTGCIFNNTLVMYGGGEYELHDSAIDGPINVELSGAALNTLGLLLKLHLVKMTNEPPTEPPWLKNPNPKININTPAEIIGKNIELVSLGKTPEK